MSSGMSDVNRTIPEEFPAPRKFFYNLGTAGYTLLDSLQASFLIYFFLPPKESGLPELVSNKVYFGMFTIFGMVYIFGRIVDSVADPLVAYWSDRSRARMGRRKWFLTVGGLPLALFAVLCFFPPHTFSSNMNAVWLAIFLGGYYFFYTFYVAPFLALIPELGHDESERISITTQQAFFSLVGAGVVMALPGLWSHLKAGGYGAVEAFQVAVVLLAIPGLILVYSAPAAVNEKRFSSAQPVDVPFFESLLATIKNRLFRVYLAANVLFWTAFHILRSTAMHYNRVVLKMPEDFYALLMVALGVGTVCSFPLLKKLSVSRGQVGVFKLGLIAFAAVSVFVPFMDATPLEAKWVGLTLFFAYGFPVAVLLVVPNALLADITEYEVALTGQDRQCMFFGAQGLFMKICMGMGTALIAALFGNFGKDVGNSLGVRLTAPTAAIFCIAAVALISAFPEKHMRDVIDRARAKRFSTSI